MLIKQVTGENETEEVTMVWSCEMRQEITMVWLCEVGALG